MTDINTYANDHLVEFVDEFHLKIRKELSAEFGENWLELGVFKHFKPDYFSTVREMLESPMRVVDMGKTEEDLYGIEHVWQIVNGNWRLFGEFFGQRAEDKRRVEVTFSEITEVRNNIAHRRGKHLLGRIDLIRFLDNCNRILSAIGSSKSQTFNELVELVSKGGMPWGDMLVGWLPPSDEIYDEFIGRSNELAGLSDWLASDSLEVAIHGYGGVGKSALAHKFAREVKQSSDDRFIAACWVSAKDREFVSGMTQDKTPDFADLDGLLNAIWIAVYESDQAGIELKPSDLVSELREMPILLVVDDFNTVLGNQSIYEFLRFDLRGTGTRIIYTSRDYVQGMTNLEVPPFSDVELKEFVSQKCHEYGMDSGHGAECLNRLAGIKSVTDGYPLFVNDLIRYASTAGITPALSTWQHRKGDAAREYALLSQIEDNSWVELLITLAQAKNALIAADIYKYSGLSQEDIIGGLESLRTKKLVNLVWNDSSKSTAYRMNANTARLVTQTYRREAPIKWETILARYKNFSGEGQSQLEKRAVRDLVAQVTNPKVSAQDGINLLKERMTGELAHAPDLHSVLGWLYSKLSADYFEEARKAFNEAHQYGSQEVDTYFHWATLEQRIAMSKDVNPQFTAQQWRECRKVCELGVERCGSLRPLCDMAGFAASREANARYLANEFTECEAAYELATFWYRKALEAPQHDRFNVSDGVIFRGLTLALEALARFGEAIDTFYEWFLSGSDAGTLSREFQRMRRQHVEFRNIQSRKSQMLAQSLNPT